VAWSVVRHRHAVDRSIRSRSLTRCEDRDSRRLARTTRRTARLHPFFALRDRERQTGEMRRRARLARSMSRIVLCIASAGGRQDRETDSSLTARQTGQTGTGSRPRALPVFLSVHTPRGRRTLTGSAHPFTLPPIHRPRSSRSGRKPSGAERETMPTPDDARSRSFACVRALEHPPREGGRGLSWPSMRGGGNALTQFW